MKLDAKMQAGLGRGNEVQRTQVRCLIALLMVPLRLGTNCALLDACSSALQGSSQHIEETGHWRAA